MLVLAALVVASGTGFYVLQGLQEPEQAVQAVEVEAPRSVEVYVPAVELAAGALITPENLSSIPIAQDSVTAEMVATGDEGALELVGSVARQVLPKGVPIARSAVVQPGERGFLAAVLPKGKRAISIPIGEVAGVSGLVLPGDRVDIILTYSVAGSTIEAARDIRASETVMTNIRVLALDQRLTKEEIPEEEGQKALTPIARTATLEVTPREAEMITLATSLGSLSLVLNSIRDGGEETVAENEADGAKQAGPVWMPVTPDPIQVRRMTLDSDVTSLLQAELMSRGQYGGNSDSAMLPNFEGGTSPVPLDDRIVRVQIVRGTTGGAISVDPGSQQSADPGAAPAVPAAPAE